MKYAEREKLYLPIVASEFAKAGLPPHLGAAIARQESAFDPNAAVLTGGDGARGGAFGLCQMTLKTALSLDKGATSGRLLDARYNAELAAKLCLENWKRFQGRIEDVISAYNSGKPFFRAPESTKLLYVPSVQKYMKQYEVTCAPYVASTLSQADGSAE